MLQEADDAVNWRVVPTEVVITTLWLAFSQTFAIAFLVGLPTMKYFRKITMIESLLGEFSTANKLKKYINTSNV